MNITVLAVGKLKDRFFEEGCGEYAKRLGRYCTLGLREAADEKTPETLSPAQEEQVKDRVGSCFSLISIRASRTVIPTFTVTV